MKKLKLIFTLLAIGLLVPSCENDGGDSKLDLQYGAAPNIEKVASSEQSINFISVNNGGDVNLSFTVGIGEGAEEIQSMDVVLIYIKGDGTINQHVLESGVTTFPKTYTVNLADIYAFFDDVNTANDITISDQLIVTSNITLKDGTVIHMTNDDGSANYGPNIATSPYYTVIQTYDVSCPLDDASNFDGMYTVNNDDWADYAAGDTVPVEYNPEVDGNYTFRILSTNNPYIDNPSTSYILVTINPEDGTVTATSNEEFIYAGFADLLVTGTGTVGSCTGDIDLTLFFGDYGPYGLSLSK